MDMFKMAGSAQALADLGLASPEELEKTAWLAAVGRALPAIGSGLKWLGSKLWGAGGKAVGTVAKPLGAAGNKAVQWTGSRLGASPETIARIQGLGKGMAGEAVGFGALGGGIEAAMADPGERGSAFMRGFGSGALGGLAFRGAGNLATAGMKRMMPKAYETMKATAKPGFFGKLEPGQSRLRSMGAKMVVGGVPFAAGMAASMYTPHFSGPQQTGYQQYAPHAARLGAGIAMPRVMGAFPGGPGYNPNLPLPQGRY
jgi:hypothetical protein